MDATAQARGHARLRRSSGVQMRRVLIVANQTATSPELIAALQARTARGPVQLHLVVPALNRRLRHWVSDTDAAISTARQRAEDAKESLRAHGLVVTVETGDSVPIVAIDDALARFDADEIVISTLPPSRSHWLEHGLVDATRDRFALPIRHVVAAERSKLAA